MKGHTGEIVSLHFNAEGDKILTGSFDRTAIVKFFIFTLRCGIPDPENAYMFWTNIREKFLVLNLNLRANFALQDLLIGLAKFGI